MPGSSKTSKVFNSKAGSGSGKSGKGAFTKSSKAKSVKTKSQKIQANVLELEELNKAMGEEMAKSNEVIAEMLELLSEEDESDTSEAVAPEPVSIVSSYNTVNASSSQAAWSGVVALVAATGVLFF